MPTPIVAAGFASGLGVQVATGQSELIADAASQQRAGADDQATRPVDVAVLLDVKSKVVAATPEHSSLERGVVGVHTTQLTRALVIPAGATARGAVNADPQHPRLWQHRRSARLRYRV